MERFEITGTQKMPTVVIEPASGLIEITGNSIPEDAGSFYRIVISKIEEYFTDLHPLTIINLNLKYYNSSTAKWLLQMFKTVKKYTENGQQVYIKWFYEEGDDTSYDSAIDYSKILNIPIRLLKAS